MNRESFPSELIKAVRSAERVAVLTGAGVSAESGVPTFREAQTGLWLKYKPEELATAEAFLRDPLMVWEWYAWRRGRVEDVQPNPGHVALAQLEKILTERGSNFTLITQNVDGLHQRAGSRNVVELHGNIRRVKCFDEGIVVNTWDDDGERPPRCPHCGAMLRPDVVWFGENLPIHALQKAYQAAELCGVFFSVGTSGLVQPAASLPMLALAQQAIVIEVNPQETPLTSSATYALMGKSGEVLPGLVAVI